MLPCCMRSDERAPGGIGATRASSSVARTGWLMAWPPLGRVWARSSAAEGGSVGAGVAAADEEPVRREPERLGVAGRVAPGVEHPHLVAAAGQIRRHAVAEPALDGEGARRRTPRPAVDPARSLD